jgi:hypothetical protein
MFTSGDCCLYSLRVSVKRIYQNILLCTSEENRANMWNVVALKLWDGVECPGK